MAVIYVTFDFFKSECRSFLTNCKSHCCAEPWHRLHRYTASKHLHELLRNGQSKSGALHVELVPVFVDHPEDLKQPSALSLRDPHVRVRHRDLQQPVAAQLDQLEGNRNAAAVRELVRVRDQVHEHLPNAVRVRVEPRAHQRGRAVDLEPEAFLSALVLEDELDLGDERGDLERLLVEREHAGLDLREVEDVFGETGHYTVSNKLTDFARYTRSRDVSVQTVSALDDARERCCLVVERSLNRFEVDFDERECVHECVERRPELVRDAREHDVQSLVCCLHFFKFLDA